MMIPWDPVVMSPLHPVAVSPLDLCSDEPAGSVAMSLPDRSDEPVRFLKSTRAGYFRNQPEMNIKTRKS
jgi:hypothetical protein